MRETTALLAATLLVFSIAAGCADDVPPVCPGYTVKDTALTVNDLARDVSCVQPAYSGPGNADSAFVQFVDFGANLRLVVFFPDFNPAAPASSFPIHHEITKAAVERLPATGGDWQVVCNTVEEGSELRIDAFAVDDTERLDDGTPNPFTWFSAFEGELDLTISGCTVPEWGVSGQPVRFTGPLVWHAD
ncbi:MAG: hypothetical protein CVU56_14005 [Deltaproteobacteria bacterium HGW-Deltaproteobacteria-14]|jgi:hypothetical protein|nr:MAG: hypothetical protein CVU56_14005 [Deltaproteobacteria bacterium HGW-Deltaproteobacteria-14]